MYPRTKFDAKIFFHLLKHMTHRTYGEVNGFMEHDFDKSPRNLFRAFTTCIRYTFFSKIICATIWLIKFTSCVKVCYLIHPSLKIENYIHLIKDSLLVSGAHTVLMSFWKVAVPTSLGRIWKQICFNLFKVLYFTKIKVYMTSFQNFDFNLYRNR